jgi:hypothetical protein
MFPFNFEWAWDAAHLVFFGGFWFAISILGAGMTFCILKSVYDTIYGNDTSEHH